MNWYSLVLKRGGDGPIDDAWKLAWEVARSPNAIDPSNAIFQKPGPGKAEITIFFTPSARMLAETFGGKRCAKPQADGVTLVAGDERAWAIHFGGESGPTPVIERLLRSTRPAPLAPAERPLHFEPTHPSGTYEPTHPAPLR
jgi:hypothetical protein